MASRTPFQVSEPNVPIKAEVMLVDSFSPSGFVTSGLDYLEGAARVHTAVDLT